MLMGRVYHLGQQHPAGYMMTHKCCFAGLQQYRQLYVGTGLRTSSPVDLSQ